MCRRDRGGGRRNYRHAKSKLAETHGCFSPYFAPALSRHVRFSTGQSAGAGIGVKCAPPLPGPQDLLKLKSPYAGSCTSQATAGWPLVPCLPLVALAVALIMVGSRWNQRQQAASSHFHERILFAVKIETSVLCLVTGRKCNCAPAFGRDRQDPIWSPQSVALRPDVGRKSN